MLQEWFMVFILYFIYGGLQSMEGRKQIDADIQITVAGTV